MSDYYTDDEIRETARLAYIEIMRLQDRIAELDAALSRAVSRISELELELELQTRSGGYGV